MSSTAGNQGRREWLGVPLRSWAAIAAAVLLVVFRSAVFAGWEQVAFNSDHAIVGLMAKHLAEGRAFPLFFYGQSYMLGVEAWLAAPIFLVAGPSVFGLHLPLVAINALVAALLVLMLRRESGLDAWTALVACLFFVLAPPVTAQRLVEPNGGSVEPFLYILLLWWLRRRPALFGVVLAFGFLHREFTVYGVLALVALTAGGLIPRPRPRELAVAAVWCAAAWGGIELLRVWSSPLGPGTSLVSLRPTQTNIGALLNRFCLSITDLPARLLALWTTHFPVLFGTAPRSFGRLGIRSVGGQGVPWLGPVMAFSLTGVVGLLVARTAAARTRLEVLRQVAFPLYLVAVGLLSAVTYATASCERMTADTLRYDLLAIAGAVGLAGAFFRIEPRRVARGAAALVIVLWAAVSAGSHARLLARFVDNPPPDDARLAADALLEQGVTCARSQYWIAYRLTFLSQERLVVASDDRVRIAAYQECARGRDVPRISSSPCVEGVQLAVGFYRCPPEPAAQNWK